MPSVVEAALFEEFKGMIQNDSEIFGRNRNFMWQFLNLESEFLNLES
ncbi:MAG: hypothetical protein PWR03_1786 [Tenuifilum sp.]|nr:hypothetical protein [Tenuifilum sp.]